MALSKILQRDLWGKYSCVISVYCSTSNFECNSQSTSSNEVSHNNLNQS